MRRFLEALWALPLAIAAASAAPDAAFPPAAAHLKRGVNILGYDGLWEGSFDNPFHLDDLRRIREAGFDHVRINFFGLRYLDKQNRLDPHVLARLDRVLDAAESNGLWVVLDQHDNTACQSAPETCKAPTLAFWRDISARYAGKRPTVVYEILNEPGGRMTHGQWNELLRDSLAQVRRREPDRTIIVPALNVSDADAVEKLAIPESDRRLIVTVHYYDPHRFTHQGASWSKELAEVHDVAWGAAASRQKVVDDFAIVARWARAQGRPVYLGEFGVLETAPPLSRAAWTRHVARTAESLGWGWAYWQFDHDFALTDPDTREWNKPLLDALTKAERP